MATTAYHVTDGVNVAGILKRGLEARIGARSAELGEEHAAVYLFPTLDELECALSNWLGEALEDADELALFEVDVTGLKDSSTVGYEFVVRGNIAPARLTLTETIY